MIVDVGLERVHLPMEIVALGKARALKHHLSFTPGIDSLILWRPHKSSVERIPSLPWAYDFIKVK